MPKRTFYTYNPATDDFERYYPSLRNRLRNGLLFLTAAFIVAFLIFLIYFYMFESPTEKNLKEENKELKERYGVLARRLDNSLKVMEDIRNRDENFFRVMMQLDPSNDRRRFSGLEREDRFVGLKRVPDATLVEEVSREMGVLERSLYVQSLSFDELREAALKQQQQISHIPQIIPLSIKSPRIASGFGYRRDPITGITKFHEGIDFAAPTGTPVYATADAVVSAVNKSNRSGFSVDLDHGYNYVTKYAHLSQIMVREGQKVKRGTIIGRVGSTGKSTGPHLHYEVRFKGEPENPVNYYFLDIGPEDYEQMKRNSDNAGHVMD